jgi:ribosome maturation factor RimP
LPNIKAKVEEIARPVIESMGYEYIETEFAKQGKDWILTLYIDSPDGINLEDCERVSRAVDPLLDEQDFIEQQYYLCVSSVGLDRPLKNERDFERNMGKCVDIKLYKPFDGVKEISGNITGYTKDDLTVLQADGKSTTLQIKDTAKISLHIDF